MQKRNKSRRVNGPRVVDPYAEREKRNYEFPIPSREAILDLLRKEGKLMGLTVIADLLELPDVREREALRNRLGAMLRDGQVLQNRQGDFGVAEKLDLIQGTVLANADGYGFLRPASGGGDDIYLSPTQMRKVLHGDRVLVSVVGVDRRGRAQGAIVEVLERRHSRLVGRFQRESGLAYVVPDDARIHQDVLVPAGAEGDANPGQIVVVEITDAPEMHRQPMGRVVRVLGEAIVPGMAIDLAIHSFGLPEEWSPEALEELSEVPDSVLEEDFEGRTDIRHLPLVTIDGADARDFDDAVLAIPRGDGFKLIVAIADVSHYVRPGSAIDNEAKRRGTSVYFPQHVVPMLPERLSNGICSLNPAVERLCFVCEMQIDGEGETTRAKFYPAVMRSHARLTYDEVWLAIGERDPATRERLAARLPELENLHRLYQVLSTQRRARGAIEFDSQEVEFRLDADGVVQSVVGRTRNDAHKLIEECMIAANVAAARHLQRKRIPSPYRVHEPPPLAKLEDLSAFLREMGLKMPPAEDIEPRDFCALLRRAAKRPDAHLIETVVLRTQSLAVYQPDNKGHFGLALDAYTHFTSPIRRYPDLLVHRALRHALAKGTPAEYLYTAQQMTQLCVACSDAERRADEAERDVDDRYKCAWMSTRVGESFDGIVSGVTSFGLFVELTESKVNGLIHISMLPNDYYHFDPRRHVITGEKRGLKFRLGDAINVIVARVDMQDRKIDFRLQESPKNRRK